MGHTSQHILVPRQNLLIRNLGRATRLINQFTVGIYDSVRRDGRQIGGFEESHISREFAVNRPGEVHPA